MLKSKKDYYFLFSLAFIIVFSGYLAFDQIQNRNLNLYLDLIHDSFKELIIEEKERLSFEKFYEKFVNNVKSDSLSSYQVKQFADNVVNLKKEKQEITAKDIKELLPSNINPNKLITLNSNGEPKKLYQDWLKMIDQFKKDNAVSDLIRKTKFETLTINSAIDNHLQAQEELSEKFTIRSERAKNFYENKKVQLANIGIAEKNKLSQIETELLNEVDSLLKENQKIEYSIESLIHIERSIAFERNKLKTYLSQLDSSTFE